MKAISIRQPFAYLIARGIKDIENRSWYTRYRGPLLIHAAKARAPDDLLANVRRRYGIMIDPEDLLYGGIVGRARLVDVVTKSKSRWFNGPYGFVLMNMRRLPFIPAKGQVGLWNPPPRSIIRKFSK